MSDEERKFRQEYLGHFPRDPILMALEKAYYLVSDKDGECFLAQAALKNGIDSIKHGGKSAEVLVAVLRSMGETVTYLHKQCVELQNLTVKPILYSKDEAKK